MLLNVAATDQAGNIIQGLKRNDFSITEDGKKQSIAVFAFQGSDLDSSPPAAGPVPFGGLKHRLITFLFDFTMMPPDDRTRIQDDAIDFIRNDLKPGELLSIETVTAGSVATTQDFTADRTALVAAVNKSRTDGIVDGNPSEFDVFNASAPLAKIAAVCRRLPIATKKSLLYFSAALEQTGADNRAALDSAANDCTTANVAIYPVGAASVSVAALATKTGGQTFHGRQPAIDEARRKSVTYYVVGYYSTNGTRDGGHRNVEVTLTQPGLQQAKLDYSQGYFMDTDFPKVTPADKEDLLKRILGLGDPVVDLPLAVEVDYFRIAQNVYLVPLSVKLPGSALTLTKKWNFTSAQLDFRDQITSGEQPVTRTLNDAITVPLTQPTMAELSSTPVTRTTQTLLPAGEHSLNLVVLENDTALVGTYRGNLKIPDLDKETHNVPMSSMALGTEWRPVTPQNDIPQPMVENGRELVPSVTHVFGKDQSVHLYAEAYDALADRRGNPKVMATVTLLRGSDAVFESKPVTLDRFSPQRDRTLTVSLEVPLANLPAGFYTIRLSLVDETGHKSGSRDAEIRVQPEGQPGLPAIPQPPPYREFSRVVCF